MATATASVAEICLAAKRAARALARVDTAIKDAALEAIAAALRRAREEILAANERDMQAGREGGSATRCSTGCAWTSSGSRRSRRGAARSPRSPTRWAR